jgi:hypothetical protein
VVTRGTWTAEELAVYEKALALSILFWTQLRSCYH